MNGWRAAVLVAFATAVACGAMSTATLGVAAGLIAAAVICCLAVGPASRRNLQRTEAVARFAAILANQASVAPTVTAALERAAPLVGGTVGRHAHRLVDECRSLGVDAAAQRFAHDAATPAAHWLADVLAIAARSGAQWVKIMRVLEAEASAVAATARHFHRRVAATMTSLVAATLMGVGIVVGTSMLNPTTWAWLTSSQGGAVALVCALATALFTGRLLFGCAEHLR